LGGRRIGYTIRESRTAHHCRIRVSSAGVEVVVPRGEPEARALAFLRESETWVLDQVAARARLRVRRARMPDRAGESILIRGQRRRIEVEESLTRRAAVAIHSRVLRVSVPDGNGDIAPKVLITWLRRQARRDILERLAERSKQMKVRPNRVYIMGQRTKWGNCSRLRNLSFNWRLVMAPPAVLDYVVVHELAHLIEPSHSPRFWFILRSHCPQFDRHRRWLREHGEEIKLQR
jgi:predicted metal-dependent hydrolase